MGDSLGWQGEICLGDEGTNCPGVNQEHLRPEWRKECEMYPAMRMGKAVRHPAAVLSMEVFLEEVEGDSSVDVILWARQGLGGKREWCGHMKQLSLDSLDIPMSSPPAQVWRWESTCCPQRVDAPPCWRHLARPGQGSPSAASLKIVFGNRQPLSLHFSLALHPLKMGLIFVHNQRLFGLLPGADGGWEGERHVDI